MPVSFLAPVFLAGLAALAIPVLIHLANRPKKRVVEFPSLMFLERVEYQESSRRRIRDLLLFLLRSLALVLLVGAFARPFVDRPVAVAAPQGGREVVVLLDRSASMAVGDRMARARAAVADVARDLRRGDRATLVLFDRDAEAFRTTDQPASLTRDADVEPGAAGTRLGPALRLAESMLVDAPLPRRELVLISDFQRAAWRPEEAPRLPPGVEVSLVDVGEELRNVSVADAEFGRERFSGRDRVRVSATVLSRGGTGRVPVELVVDGRTLQTVEVELPDQGPVGVQFEPVTVPDRTARGTVRAGSDAMPADNAFHFTLAAGRSLRVLVAVPGSGSGPFLERALEVASQHDVGVVPADRLDDAALADVDVVVVAGEPDGVDRLTGWVEAGGGLLVVLGPRSRARTWGDGLLPGSLDGTRDGGATGVALTALEVDHPALAAFRARPDGLAGARFFRYRELEPADGDRVLARLGGDPALVERRVGQGRVIALASTLDGEWNDLVLQPGFVPLLHGLVRHASGREERPAWRQVGDLLDPGELLAGTPGAGVDGAEPVLLTPSDRPVPLRRDSLHRLTERGFYEIRDPRSPELGVLVAVNGDPAESEPERVDTAEVRARIAGGQAVARASLSVEDRERRQSLWWYALAGAFVLLAAETALSNGLSRRRALPRPEEREGP